MSMDWLNNPDAINRLLECPTEELEETFPGISRKTLINRRGEFRRNWVPESSHAGGDTAKTVNRITKAAEKHSRRRAEEVSDLVPRDLYTKAVQERDEAKDRLRRYVVGPQHKVSGKFSGTAGQKQSLADSGVVHVVIPDTQAKPGSPTDHLSWIGQYIIDHLAGRPNVKIIHLGDHADLPSLSSYDKGKKAMEGRRVVADIEAANEAFEELNEPLLAYNRGKKPEKQWWPERYITLGNHEDRITRATEDDAQLDGLMSLDDLNYADLGWHVQPYLKPLFLDGVAYAHYFYNPMSGRPYAGQAITRLKTIGHSFSMGHQQQLDHAVRFVANSRTGEPTAQHALVAGACYLASEGYKGPTGNAHWRGIIVCHDVREGNYDAMYVSLDYLCRRYEGMSVERFVKKKYNFDYMGI